MDCGLPFVESGILNKAAPGFSGFFNQNISPAIGFNRDPEYLSDSLFTGHVTTNRQPALEAKTLNDIGSDLLCPFHVDVGNNDMRPFLCHPIRRRSPDSAGCAGD